MGLDGNGDRRVTGVWICKVVGESFHDNVSCNHFNFWQNDRRVEFFGLNAEVLLLLGLVEIERL